MGGGGKGKGEGKGESVRAFRVEFYFEGFRIIFRGIRNLNPESRIPNLANAGTPTGGGSKGKGTGKGESVRAFRVEYYFEGKSEAGAAAVEIGEWEGALEEVLMHLP